MNRRTFFASVTAGALRAQTGPRAAAPRILLISGWNLYNIGDVAITPGFLRLVQTHFPEARVTVLAASYPEELRDYLSRRFSFIDLIPMEFKAGIPLSPAMEHAFASADLLVLNSGMTLSYGYYGLEWNNYMPRILAFMKARAMGIPYGVYGHSFDKVEPHADILYSDVLSTAGFIYTRDSESLKLLQSRGIRSPEMAFGPDSTFAFDLQDKGFGESFLREHRLEARKYVAFVPRLDVNRFRNDGQEQVHAQRTREIITRWVRQTREPVALVPEVQRQIEPARTQVYDLLPDDVHPFVRFRPDFWMPDQAQAVYSRARMVVSFEMHSVILGLAAGTPSLHPYFSQAGLKQWMMRDIGAAEWLFDVDAVAPDRIAAAMLAIREDYRAALARTRHTMDYVARRQSDTMAVVRRTALAHFNKRASMNA